MLINMSKTKEIIFRSPSIKHFLTPARISDVAQVSNAKLLGVILLNYLHFDEQITGILQICSQPIFSKCPETRDCQKRIWILFFMLLFYVKFAAHCVHGAVTLLRLTKDKLMPFCAGCIDMDM